MAEIDERELIKYTDWLDGRDGEIVGHIERLCNINSGTMNLAGIEAVQRELASLYAPLEGAMEHVDSQPLDIVDDQGRLLQTPLGRTILITKYPERRPRVLLCIHCDTVYGSDHSFQQCRWLEGNLLNGPGVIDAKGGLMVMLYALLTLERSPLAGRLGWQVIINPDEEIGSPGSGGLLRDLAAQADWGLLFEPALPDGSMISWRKGSGNFVFVVRGRAAHSGRDFQQGRNAIAALSRLLVEIDDMNVEPQVTYNVGRISGGGALNIVPDLAVGRVNVRVKTVHQQHEVERKLKHLVDHYNLRDGIRVELHGSFSSPPKPLDVKTEALQRVIERAGKALQVPVGWQGSGGASDGNKFAAAGLPNVDSLGPSGGEIHSSNEFLMVDSLVPRTKLAALTLLQLAAAAE